MGMGIFSKLFGETKRNSTNKVDGALKKAFESIKEEFTEHRESINQNTNEIQSNYEYLCKLETKMDKLTERMDELTLVLTKGNIPYVVETSAPEEKDVINVPKLSVREQEIFLVLYTAEEPLTYKSIARKAALNESLVMNYIVALISKGVPLIKRYVNNVVYVILDHEFKQLQAKENLLNINEEITARLQL